VHASPFGAIARDASESNTVSPRERFGSKGVLAGCKKSFLLDEK